VHSAEHEISHVGHDLGKSLHSELKFDARAAHAVSVMAGNGQLILLTLAVAAAVTGNPEIAIALFEGAEALGELQTDADISTAILNPTRRNIRTALIDVASDGLSKRIEADRRLDQGLIGPLKTPSHVHARLRTLERRAAIDQAVDVAKERIQERQEQLLSEKALNQALHQPVQPRPATHGRQEEPRLSPDTLKAIAKYGLGSMKTERELKRYDNEWARRNHAFLKANPEYRWL
jgi:hypothetical protein